MDNYSHLTPELREVASLHVHRIDKLYRMYAGIASDLKGFTDESMILEVRIGQRPPNPLEEMVRKLAASWHAEPELRSAKRFVAYVYTNNRPVGLSVDTSPFQRGDIKGFAEVLVKQLRALGEPRTDVLLEVIEGELPEPSSRTP